MRLRRGLRLATIAAVLAAGVVGACKGAYDETATVDAGPDASTVTTAPVEAGPADPMGDAGACDRSKPFSPGVHVIASRAHHFRLSPDERIGYLTVFPDGGNAMIGAVTRQTPAGEFGSPTLLPTLNTQPEQASATVSADGLFLVLEQYPYAAHVDLAFSSRPNLTAQFSPPVTFDVSSKINTNFVTSPYLRPDGQELYFTFWEPGGARRHLRRSLPVAGVFGEPTDVTELNAGPLDDGAVVTADDLTIYWHSNRADGGQGHIYVATRTAVGLPFSNIHDVPELNGAFGEFPTWISPDGCRLYYLVLNDIFVASKAH